MAMEFVGGSRTRSGAYREKYGVQVIELKCLKFNCMKGGGLNCYI